MTDTHQTLQKALFTIKKLKKLLQEQSKNSFEPIAIVGLGCRFPHAENKDKYWELLRSGQNAISELPEARWNLLQGTDEIALRDKKHHYWGSFLENIPAFDAYFFGISPREALRMDPQQRMLLEVAYEAIEDAGFTLESLVGSNTGVFTSLYASQFAYLQKLDTDLDALFIPTGNATSIAANRLSYLFDLRGPSIVMDTACSSSLVALHLACVNLQNKLCDLALVCGANINLLPSINSVLAKAKMLSPNGQCNTFDASANGYVQGEGIGVIVLKPLSKAVRDNDKIYAVIQGSAVNQDGRTNGLTAPNGLQQERLLQSAYQIANVQPEEISYIECHGTGTFLGDPIEIQALGEVVGKHRDAQKPCWIGSVKTNIGHLEPAAGMASVIKVALALKHGEIPAHLNFVKPNPHIAFDKYHFRVPLQLQQWPRYGENRLAGVSGFGFGGTNAHVVLREYSEKTIEHVSGISQPELFTLSAKEPGALQGLIKRWCEFLEKHPTLNLSQICYNTHIRRSHFSYRLAIIADSTHELHQLLSSIITNTGSSKIFISEEKIDTTNAKVNIQDLNELAKAYVHHAVIDWKKYEENRHFPCLDLPRYCWQHKNYWPSFKTITPNLLGENDHPLRGRKIDSPLRTLQFEFQLSTHHFPELLDTYHIAHLGYYLEMMGFAINQLNRPVVFTIEDLKFIMALIVPDNITVSVQLILEVIDKDIFEFHFYSFSDSQKKWIEHANGKLNLHEISQKNKDISELKSVCQQTEDTDNLYNKIITMGMPVGGSIRWTTKYDFTDDQILCEFETPDSCKNNRNFKLNVHLGIFDGCVQPLFKFIKDDLSKPFMVSHIKKIQFYGMQNSKLFYYGKMNSISEKHIEGDYQLLNANGQILVEFDSVTLSQLDNKIQIEKLMQDSNETNLDIGSMTLNERKQYVTDFLLDQVASLFSMPKEDIHIHRSLRELGIDSLMALVLMKSTESKLGTTFSLQMLLDGPTIAEMRDFILNTVGGSSEEHTNPWISYRKPQKNVQIRLFCLPYGGSGASIYRDWQQHLPETIEVCPIQLPGRENRMDEKPISQIQVIIDELTKNLINLFDLPFALYGHSFGSLIAFELARHLRAQNLPLPKHLFLGAYPDPRIPTYNLDRLLSQLDAISIKLSNLRDPGFLSSLTDEQIRKISDIFCGNGIVDYGDHLMNRDIINVLLPIFLGDMSIVKSYQYHDEKPLNLPITVFSGKKDGWVNYEDHLKWNEHTSNKFIIHSFESGHLFLKVNSIKLEMLRIMAEELHVKQVTENLIS